MIGSRTLFATHYHELTDLAHTRGAIQNYNVAVREWNDEIIFLRKIVEGTADKSYGIQVARLAGLPPKIIERAKDILSHLELHSSKPDAQKKAKAEEYKVDYARRQQSSDGFIFPRKKKRRDLGMSLFCSAHTLVLRSVGSCLKVESG